jgi:hypothetical protein
MLEKITSQQAEILRGWADRRTEYPRGEQLSVGGQIPGTIVVAETFAGSCYLVEVVEPRGLKVGLYRITEHARRAGFRGEREISEFISVGGQMRISETSWTSEVRSVFSIDPRDLPASWRN